MAINDISSRLFKQAARAKNVGKAAKTGEEIEALRAANTARRETPSQLEALLAKLKSLGGQGMSGLQGIGERAVGFAKENPWKAAGIGAGGLAGGVGLAQLLNDDEEEEALESQRMRG